jgi:hypothetical protein
MLVLCEYANYFIAHSNYVYKKVWLDKETNKVNYLKDIVCVRSDLVRAIAIIMDHKNKIIETLPDHK